MIIAIDGLGVNGKSTLAKIIADDLNLKFCNTGAIYRCIALEIINNNLDVNNINSIIEYFKNINIDFDNERVLLEGIDVSNQIRTETISVKSTEWATIPEIKELVRTIQKEYINKNDVVIEGRDICTRIAPNADFKFYLYSDFETRVKRLYNSNKSVDIDTIRNNLLIRDKLDIDGKNFIKPEDAVEIDTTNLSIDEVYKIMLKVINSSMEEKMDLKNLTNEEIVELIKQKKVTAGDLTDAGICPTCFNKANGGVLYGDDSSKIIYEDDDFECFLVHNPRANGHVAISTKKHFKDMMEIDDETCQKIFVLSKAIMNVLKEVYDSESVYLCTMCDGPMNHFHIQLIPRYSYEKRGSENFVKKRFDYVEDKEKLGRVRTRLNYNGSNSHK